MITTRLDARYDDLRANWNRVTGAIESKDPVLRSAIKHPRVARGYGDGAEDYGVEDIGVRGVDTYIKIRQRTLH